MTKNTGAAVRASIVGLAAVIALTVVVGVPGATASASQADVGGGPYLALGDSIPLGYSPRLEDPWMPERFVGYPELIEQQTGMTTTNLACPGQTAQALISRDAPDAGCFEARDDARAEGFALLHDDYDGTQLDAALAAVRSDTPPSLISIQGGGNEILICLDDPHPQQCLNTVLPKVTASLSQAVTDLRAAGYPGRVVLVGYHLVPGLRAELRRMNSAIERAASESNAAFADAAVPFDRYARKHDGDLCTAKLLIKLRDGSCDLHPTRTGQRLFADAVLGAAALKQP